MPTTDSDVIWKILWSLLAMLMSIFTWLGKQLFERVGKLEENTVRKEDLVSMEARLNAARTSQHEENKDRFTQVREDIGSLRALLYRGRARGDD